MIVSHHQSYVFVAIPKTGSQSVRKALRPGLTPTDWEQCGLFEVKRFPIPALADIGHGHITCRQIKPFLGESLWSRYRKFAFVRDPFERFSSMIRFRHPGEKTAENLLQLGKRTLSDSKLSQHPLALPQCHFICDADGQPMVDTIGRYSSLATDFQRITADFGLTAGVLPHINASPNPQLQLPVDDELHGMIQHFYRQDFQLLAEQVAL